MRDDRPLRAVRGHGADALVDVVTVVNPRVDPVVRYSIRSAEVCAQTNDTNDSGASRIEDDQGFFDSEHDTQRASSSRHWCIPEATTTGGEVGEDRLM